MSIGDMEDNRYMSTDPEVAREYWRERANKLEQQLAELREAVRAAFDCEMIPKSSASDGGASKYSEQVMVADRLRAALQEGGG